MNKTILVAGGAGFLGSHLSERLLNQGHRVICLDNLFTGSEENIGHLMNRSSFQFIHHDVCVPIHVDVDEIYNFACPASPLHYQADPIQTTKTSVLGAIHLLALAQRLGCKIFQASTSEVYGDPHVHPQTEAYWGNVNPIGERACYDEGKRCAETLFFDYYRKYQTQIRVARIFNTYGPRMHPNDGRVVSNFIVQAIANQPITIYGTGHQTRSFCYVDDLIDIILLFMNGDHHEVGPLNIGNPYEYRVLDLAQEVIRLSQSSSSIVHHSLPADDPRQRKPDIQKATTLFGWKPKIQLEEGLLLTLSYFKKKLALQYHS